MTDDTKKIMHELRVIRTILLELTGDVAARRIEVLASAKFRTWWPTHPADEESVF
jgi:hypothetical protein